MMMWRMCTRGEEGFLELMATATYGQLLVDEEHEHAHKQRNNHDQNLILQYVIFSLKNRDSS